MVFVPDLSSADESRLFQELPSRFRWGLLLGASLHAMLFDDRLLCNLLGLPEHCEVTQWLAVQNASVMICRIYMYTC